MTTPERNEAAERLLGTLRNEYARNRPVVLAEYLRGYEEGVRRATVERIRAELARSAAPGAHSAAVNGFRQTVAAILDEEANATFGSEAPSGKAAR